MTGEADPLLFAAAETVAALEDAEAVALLIGSYDGSGNFGDIAQLDATLELLEPLAEELLVLPVLELSRSRDHAELAGPRMSQPLAHPLFMGPGEPRADDRLRPVPPAMSLEFAALFLYGGGYLNRFWGRRKLDMLAAAEDLIRSARRVRRVGSGLQAERDWLTGLVGADREALDSFELLGSRDPKVRPGARGSAFADGQLRKRRRRGRPAVKSPAWRRAGWRGAATGEPPLQRAGVCLRPAGRDPGLLRRVPRSAGIGSRAAGTRPAANRLPGPPHRRAHRLGAAAQRLRGSGDEVDEPLILAPTDIDAVCETIGAASLTLACSYHAGLASLMTGVPAVSLRENDYYDQKVAGLREAFELPDELTVGSGDDAAECARRVAALVLDEERGALLRAGLRERARLLAERRRRAEVRLRGRLALAGPSHEIVDLRATPGELRFTARIDEDRSEVWFQAETAATPTADAALATCLLPAMRSGGRLTMRDPVSPRLLRTQRDYQAIQAAWSRDWDLDQPPLREVEVQASTREPAAPAEGRVAAFFSGGVDSWSTVLGNPEVTDLIFVHGLDLIPGAAQHAGLADEVERRLRGVAADLGRKLHVVTTNARTFSDPLVAWEAYNPGLLAAVALFLEPLFERVLIAGDTDHLTQVPMGVSRMVDHLWSTERLEIVENGGRFSREQRLARIASHPLVQRSLRVCWENRGGAYNCGRCRKCLVTMISLEAIGARERFSSFPDALDLDLLPGITIRAPVGLVFWEDLLDTTRRARRADLERPVAAVVERTRLEFGLAPSYRGRDGSGGRGPIGALRESGRRVAAAEQEAAQAQAQLDLLVGSRSWRLTAPLRRAGGGLRRLRGRRERPRRQAGVARDEWPDNRAVELDS